MFDIPQNSDRERITMLQWELRRANERIAVLEERLAEADITPELVAAKKALVRVERMARDGKLNCDMVIRIVGEGMKDIGSHIPRRGRRKGA